MALETYEFSVCDNTQVQLMMTVGDAPGDVSTTSTSASSSNYSRILSLSTPTSAPPSAALGPFPTPIDQPRSPTLPTDAIAANKLSEPPQEGHSVCFDSDSPHLLPVVPIVAASNQTACVPSLVGSTALHDLDPNGPGQALPRGLVGIREGVGEGGATTVSPFSTPPHAHTQHRSPWTPNPRTRRGPLPAIDITVVQALNMSASHLKCATGNSPQNTDEGVYCRLRLNRETWHTDKAPLLHGDGDTHGRSESGACEPSGSGLMASWGQSHTFMPDRSKTCYVAAKNTLHMPTCM